jgi:uncharacterized protein with gpF-like domain
MASRSADPRDAHKQYYGIIKPVDDPFWDWALPPIDWGCKCGAKQTREGSSPTVVERVNPPQGIAGNAGKTGQIFTPGHEYVAGVPQGQKAQVHERYTSLFTKAYKKEVNDYVVEQFTGKEFETTQNLQVSVAKTKVKKNIDDADLETLGRMRILGLDITTAKLVNIDDNFHYYLTADGKYYVVFTENKGKLSFLALTKEL